MLKKTFYALLACLYVSTGFAVAQVTTGIYANGSFDTRGPDTINVGNLNMHLNVPVLHKNGRGLPFVYDLNYDSSVWYPSSASGTPVWTPVTQWGWKGTRMR